MDGDGRRPGALVGTLGELQDGPGFADDGHHLVQDQGPFQPIRPSSQLDVPVAVQQVFEVVAGPGEGRGSRDIRDHPEEVAGPAREPDDRHRAIREDQPERHRPSRLVADGSEGEIGPGWVVVRDEEQRGFFGRLVDRGRGVRPASIDPVSPHGIAQRGGGDADGRGGGPSGST